MNKFFRSFFLSRAIERTLRKFNPDVIHVHLDALEYLPGNIRGRLLYTCHSTVQARLVDHPEEDMAAKKLAGKYKMRFIALHDDMAQELNDRYGVENSIVVNNGIDLLRFRDVKETRQEIRKSLSIPENAFVVGHVGRFVPVKNHDFLLKVFGCVHEKNPDAFLLLVGDGEHLEDFKAKVRVSGLGDSILILSNRTDIPQLLKAMDVFVFPSLFEGLGIALVEAQAAGLRCIVSDSVPERAFLTDLAIPMSLEAPVESWRDAVIDKGLRSKYGNKLEDFDIRSAVRRLEKVYLGEI